MAHDGRPNDAGGGGKQSADQHDRYAKSAPELTEQAAHGLQQIFGDPALVEHRAHQNEKRNGDQNVVGEDAVDPLAECAEKRDVHGACDPADIGEGDRHSGNREGDRKPEQDAADKCGEHHDIKPLVHTGCVSELSSSFRTIASDCIKSRMQKAGISDLSRKTAGSPPTEIGPSRMRHEDRTIGHDQ